MELAVLENFLKELIDGLDTFTNAFLILLEQCQVEVETKKEGGR